MPEGRAGREVSRGAKSYTAQIAKRQSDVCTVPVSFVREYLNSM